MRSTSCPICGGGANDLLCTKHGASYVRCRACGHAFLSEPASESSLAEFYSSRTSHHQSDSKIAWDYSELKDRHFYRPILDRIARHAPNRVLLDVGCSNGAFINAASKHGWQACGIDLETGSVEIARSRGLVVHNAKLADQAYPNGAFGAVTLWQMIEHVDDPHAIISEAHRILNRQGVLALSTPNVNSVGWRLLGPNWHAVEPEVHMHLFSPSSLDRLLSSHGFRKISLRTADIKPQTVRGVLKRKQGGGGPQRFAEFASEAGDRKLRLMFRGLALANAVLSPLGLGEDIYAYYAKESD